MTHTLDVLSAVLQRAGLLVSAPGQDAAVNALATDSRAVAPGALAAFLDNRYVEGSSTPVSRRDAEGNSYQARTLADGSTHEVLKNFPGESDLLRRASGHGRGAHVDLLPHYWLLTWRAPN